VKLAARANRVLPCSHIGDFAAVGVMAKVSPSSAKSSARQCRRHECPRRALEVLASTIIIR
jgi:hypothetical protein